MCQEQGARGKIEDKSRYGRRENTLQFFPWLLAPGTCGRSNLSKLCCEYVSVLMYHMLNRDMAGAKTQANRTKDIIKMAGYSNVVYDRT
jgi:hypothetical protein